MALGNTKYLVGLGSNHMEKRSFAINLFANLLQNFL